MATKRGETERYMGKHGYDAPLPHYWLDVFDDDLDAQIASFQNLVAGGHGEWYGGRERTTEEQGRDPFESGMETRGSIPRLGDQSPGAGQASAPLSLREYIKWKQYGETYAASPEKVREIIQA